MGRPRNSPNKVTKAVREKFQQLVENQLETLEEDFASLPARERIKYTLEMARFCIPQLKAVELGNGIGGETYDFNETLKILRGETFAK